MPTDTLSYEVVGHDMQLVRVDMQPGQTLIAEAGAMVYMDDGISFEAKAGDGTETEGVMGSLWGMAKRAASGAGVFFTHYRNDAGSPRRIFFGANRPGKVLVLDLAEWGGELFCEHGSFLCAEHGTHIEGVGAQSVMVGAFGGAGFLLQKISGRGKVFVHACGSVLTEDLSGNTIKVEPGALVAFSTSIAYDIERAGNLKTMMFGGEGLFLANLQGTGRVILQSLPWSRVVHHIVEAARAR